MQRFLRLVLVMASSFPLTVFAQSVSNVRAFNEDGTIMVVYDLFTAKNEKEFFIKLYYSTDKGKTYNEATSATGDVNGNVKAGSDLTVTWKPTNTATNDLVFKVEALPKFVKASSKASVENLALMSAKRREGNIIELSFVITNDNPASIDFNVSQFMIKDNKGANFSIMKMTTKSWSAVGIPYGANGQFTVEVYNVTIASKSIKKLLLLSGSKSYSFENIDVIID